MQRIVIIIALLWTAMATVTARAAEDSIDQRCPHFVQWRRAHPELSDAHRRENIHLDAPTDPVLREALLAMARVDQASRETAFKADASRAPDRGAEFARVSTWDAAHLFRIKPIIERDGFPDAARVGLDGVEAAFLLVQHADADPALQAQVLPQLIQLARHGEIGGQQVALLTDRVLVHQHTLQRYGTQFADDARRGGLALKPVEDSAHLDARRAAIGLPPLADYACVLSVSYNKPVHLKP